ncbi:fungal specific transcription factor domain-containing protein [Aspergillus lucknowensis]|uniref:Zn(2)-C6 fungal-type domain-containing protein n=1 Tax=Aspergillus lucknowensis TaxID=176173 RepID=A0ABR4LXS5_9EURO
MSSQSLYQGSDPGSRVGKRRAAPYGQACLHCFKTKSKCVKQNGSGSCERCLRLKKQYGPADSLRKRTSSKTSNPAALIANLEDRVGSLTSLLHEVAANSASPASLREAIERQQQLQEENARERAEERHEDSQHSEASTSANIEELSPEEEKSRLFVFRSRMLQFFAFMYLPPTLTAQQLREKRPLLFGAIMAVTSASAQERRARGKEIKRLFAEAAVEETNSSIDLLLCVLTYAVWGYDHFINKVSSPSRLTQLATSLAYDLRLNKPRPIWSHQLPSEVPLPNQQGPDTRLLEDSAQQTLETKRAVLGCFLLSSMLSSHFGQTDPMRWTPQMERYLHDISRNTQCATDEMFALQVRLQLLAQQASEQRDQRELDRYQVNTVSATPSSIEPLLSSAYLKTLQTKLQDIQATIPPSLKQEKILMTHLYYASLSIYETVYPVNPNIKLSPSSSILPSTFEELDCHSWSLGVIVSWFENFFAFPISDWIGFCFPLWAQLMRCLIVLLRLSVPSAGWNCQAVRSTLDLLGVVDELTKYIKRAAVEANEKSPDDLFGIFYRITRSFGAYAAANLRPMEQEQQISQAANQGAISAADIGCPWGGPEFEASMLIYDDAQVMQWFGWQGVMGF